MKVVISSSGDLRSIKAWLDKSMKGDYSRYLKNAGRKGQNALVAATPVDTGNLSSCWAYETTDNSVTWINTAEVGTDIPLAVMMDQGHGTGTGGYVPGYNYIMPAIEPVIDSCVRDILEEVIKDG